LHEKYNRKEASPHTILARAAIEAWVKERRVLSDQEGIEQRKLLKVRAAAFVSLKKAGLLRGCIGTFQPAQKTLADEIASNAVNAASCDPRFSPVKEEELDDLDISVDVLGEPEPVPDPSYLDPRHYGVIVQAGRRVGLLLPDLEGVDSVEEQLDIARRKAGINPGEPIQMYRFTVDRFH
jgi:AmmeMemoRadiSam system protein A